MSGPVFPALLERPSAAAAPAITGGSAVGSTLSCSNAGWAPDLLPAFLYRAPHSVAYTWSRDGEAIASATTSSYTPHAAGDYRCTVAASNQAGTTSQTSAPHHVSSQLTSPRAELPPRAPVLRRLRISPPAFRGAASGPSALPAWRRGGALVSFTLDRAARLRFGIERATSGRRVGARCVKPTRSNRARRRCTRYTTLGGFARERVAGANRLRFSGRLSARRLRSAGYRLVAIPSADGLRGDAKRVRFRVKG